MATTLKEISDFLTEEGLKHGIPEGKDFIRTGFKMENYKDPDGDPHLRVIVRADEDGEFVKVFAPSAYKCPTDANSFNRLSLFQTLLQVSWMTKMLQFEYDAEDGEIRPMIEFPLEDAKLTRRQIARCVHAMPQIIDKYHDDIQDAIKHGLAMESPNKNREAFEEFMRQRREERRRDLGDVE
jgi:hypothetical protein